MPTFDACSSCGKQVYRTRTSRAEITCRECRRKQSVPYRPAQPRPPCATCGGQLSGKAKVYCSRRCANQAPRKRRPARLRACEICGNQFRPARTDKPQRACSRACGVELKRRDGTIPGKAPSCPVWIRECAHCGELFVGRRANKKTCSADCGRRLNWAKSSQARRVTEHRCPCGASIQPSRNKCDDCLSETRRERRRKERARKRESMAAEPYTLAEIAARDRYRCGICVAEGRSRQARVAMTKAVPHPKAPTIDHVVPWSISKDDTRANVQLAHFLCNSRKCTGGSQQLALIG
jgi:hypothetical protein